jgi:pimeloyl-ACP methyl ester carboxylesterase
MMDRESDILRAPQCAMNFSSLRLRVPASPRRSARRSVLGLVLGTLLLAPPGCAGALPPAPEETGILQSAERAGGFTRAQAQLLATELGFAAELRPGSGAEMFSIRYRTTGVDGQPTVASGAVWIPAEAAAVLPVAVYLHGTTFPRTNVPSNPANQEGRLVGALFATTGYLLVMPDFLGMGASPGFHPWHHAASTASASLDALRAARELADQRGLDLEDRLFLFGYSQGGHATLALHREIERTGYTPAVTASAPMAGAYDLEGSSRRVLREDPSDPTTVLYAAYLATALNQVHRFAPDLRTIFVAPYDGVAADLLAGQHTAAALGARLPQRPRELFQPAFLHAIEADPDHALWRALRENSVYDWRPDAPVTLFHGGGDRVVPIENAVTAEVRMRQLGGDVELIDLGPRLDHGTAALPSLLGGWRWFQELRRAPVD